jgi:uncharacterized protein
MEFDRFTIALLVARPDAPALDEQQAAELQNAHMSYLADLHEAGHVLAVGPLRDATYRGLSILNVEPDEARRLKEHDPAIRAGLYSVETIPWLVPAGLVSFTPGHVPRSIAEVTGG